MIENWELFGGMLNVDQGQQAALRAAQKVIARLRRRDLYKYCSEALIPQVGSMPGSAAWGAGCCCVGQGCGRGGGCPS